MVKRYDMRKFQVWVNEPLNTTEIELEYHFKMLPRRLEIHDLVVCSPEYSLTYNVGRR